MKNALKWKFSIAGRYEEFVFDGQESMDGQTKKRIRMHIIEHMLPPKLVPFHAVLLRREEKGLLVCGGTGTGKTTLAKRLCDQEGYHIVANDMVVVWEQEWICYAGDLNLQEENWRKGGTRIERVIFLSPDDKRDCWCASKEEILKLYHSSLPEISTHRKQYFVENPLFSYVTRNTIALGNRQSEERWHRTIHTLQNTETKRIGVVGVGAVGSTAISLLSSSSKTQEFHLYDPNQNKLNTYVMDLKSAESKPIQTHFSIKTLLQQVDLLLLTFRVKNQSSYMHSDIRFRKLMCHGGVVWDIARAVRKTPVARVLVVTNPVDVLAWAVYYLSNLNDQYEYDGKGLLSSQVIGVGLGLDFRRVCLLFSENLEIVGEHGDDAIICEKEGGYLRPVTNKTIKERFLQYTSFIQEGQRSVFGPAHEIHRVIDALSETGRIVRVSTMQESGVFLGGIYRHEQGVLRTVYSYTPQLQSDLQPQIEKHRAFQQNVLDMKKGDVR